MVGKDLRRKPARDGRAASSSGVRDWASKRSQRVTRRDKPRVCSRKGLLMDLHRDVLARLSPSVPRAVTVVADAPADRLNVWGGRDFDDIVDEWGAQSFPASDPPSNW
jgi:hypothetical protein